MLTQLVLRAEAKAARTARSAAIGFGAGVCLCIGLFFWTVAAWIFLLSVTSAGAAAVVLACAYTGAGLIGLGVLSLRRRRVPPAAVAPPAPPPAVGLDGLVDSFMKGVQAGSRVRGSRRRAGARF